MLTGKPFSGNIIENKIALPEIDNNIGVKEFFPLWDEDPDDPSTNYGADPGKVKLSVACWGLSNDEKESGRADGRPDWPPVRAYLIWGRFIFLGDGRIPEFSDGVVYYYEVDKWLDCPELNFLKY